MKKSLIVSSLCAIVFMAACSSNDPRSANETLPESGQSTNEVQETANGALDNNDHSAAAEGQKGKSLIQSMDCVGCHKEQGRIVGPSYAEIAAKYEANDKNIDYLASKIISGGSGVWGDVAMTAHPNLSKEDASEIARYILTVK